MAKKQTELIRLDQHSSSNGSVKEADNIQKTLSGLPSEFKFQENDDYTPKY